MHVIRHVSAQALPLPCVSPRKGWGGDEAVGGVDGPGPGVASDETGVGLKMVMVMRAAAAAHEISWKRGSDWWGVVMMVGDDRW
jgi:hypothetical protein